MYEILRNDGLFTFAVDTSYDHEISIYPRQNVVVAVSATLLGSIISAFVW